MKRIDRIDDPGRVLIVDDHAFLAEGLAEYLRTHDLAAEAVQPVDATSVISRAAEYDPDLVLLDYYLSEPIGTALPLIGPLSASGRRVVMLTAVKSRVRLAECVEAGAVGVVGKGLTASEVLEKVREAILTGSLLDPGIRHGLLAELRLHRQTKRELTKPFAALTKREREVLRMLLEGLGAAEIADTSYVSISTVRSQIHSILLKLDVHSQLAAVAKARRAGFGS